MSDEPKESTTEEAAEAKQHTMADANSPEARFTILVSSIATQALVGLGEFEHPITKQKEIDLGSAQYSIDLLQTLVDKTKGNLNPDEERYLTGILYDLRMRFVDATNKPEEKPSE